MTHNHDLALPGVSCPDKDRRAARHTSRSMRGPPASTRPRPSTKNRRSVRPSWVRA